MCRPAFRIEQEKTATLKETLSALRANGGDKDLIAAIVNELAVRSLGMKTESGWPTVLDDPKDDGLPFDD